MGYAELIANLQALPVDKQTEVFDFVDFLVSRFGGTGKPSHWQDTEFQAFAVAQAMRGLEAEAAIYTEDDLRERW